VTSPTQESHHAILPMRLQGTFFFLSFNYNGTRPCRTAGIHSSQYKPQCERSYVYMKQWTRDLICKTLIFGAFAVRQSVAVTHTGLHGRMLGKELNEREKVSVFSNIPALNWRRWM